MRELSFFVLDFLCIAWSIHTVMENITIIKTIPTGGAAASAFQLAFHRTGESKPFLVVEVDDGHQLTFSGDMFHTARIISEVSK